MIPMSIILGFSGLLASGKGTSAEYLKHKHNASTYRFSKILRDILDRVYVDQTRDNLIRVSEVMRDTFGEDLLAKAMAGDVQNDDSAVIVVDGIRRMADIEHLQKLPNFVLVEIFADPEIRYERLIKRSENSDDQTKTYEQFLADHERSTEKSILDVVKKATKRVNNNGSFEELYQQLDKLVTEA